ncbi:MAG: hypothetical protein II889_02765 [Clostridia bacterium]|nr:hypothetical protein [Clostridia bacterium]MCR4905850.1 hypothetical protein [Clostridiales bacterium]
MKADDRIEKICKYCAAAETLSDPDSMLCRRLGVVKASFCCRRFRYDPLKRTPGRPRKTVPGEELEFPEID